MNKPLIVIDLNVIYKSGITIEEFFYLYSLFINETIHIVDDSIDYDKLEKLLFIKIIDKQFYLRSKARDLFEILSVKISFSNEDDKKIVKRSKRAINKEIDDRINEFRNKWKGLKPGSMGALHSCKEKLSRWMDENPEYSFEDILKAADLYLSTEGTNLKFLQRADYFIYKKDGREESSRLSAFVDDVGIANDDWTSNLN